MKCIWKRTLRWQTLNVRESFERMVTNSFGSPIQTFCYTLTMSAKTSLITFDGWMLLEGSNAQPRNEESLWLLSPSPRGREGGGEGAPPRYLCKAMQQLLSIVMLVLATVWSFTPRGDVHELREVADLVEHYMEHRLTDNASVASFLASHYGRGGADHESDAHARLPLKPHAVQQIVCSDVISPVALPVPQEAPADVPAMGTVATIRHLPGPSPFQPPRP